MKNILFQLCFCFFSISLLGQTIELEEIASGFDSPVDIANAGDDRLFIVERSGRIKIIDGSGAILATPFLDIDNIVHNAGFQSEQGLLGLAFHPDYITNGYFFLNYIDNEDSTVIARYSRDASNPNLADPNSEVILMTIHQNYNNHNGGCIKFGPDGYLYIGMGDEGSSNDPMNNSQNPQSLHGKMLRIDVSNNSYTIPTDNPFITDPNTLNEIWALGLRNPWRFSFDRATGDLWIGDVGQGAWEEINYQPSSSTGGENYGWRCYEGNHVNGQVSQVDCENSDQYDAPVYEIMHPGGFGEVCSITGGFVYRGSEYPSLVGKYICADFCSGEFFTVEPDGGGGWIGQEVADFNYPITTFGEDVNGELYCASLSGEIYKVKADLCSSLTSSVNVTNEPCEGEMNGSVEISGAGGLPPYSLSPILDLNSLAADTYNITITDANSCSTSQMFTVNALPLPTPPTVSVNDNMLTVPSNFLSYQWLLNGQVITGAIYDSYSILESGSYSIEVTGANGCSNTSTETFVTFTSLDAISNLEIFNISPNPFSKNILVEIQVSERKDLKLEILDSNGKIVFLKKINIEEKIVYPIDLQELCSGIYYLNLKSAEGVVGKKIIKI